MASNAAAVIPSLLSRLSQPARPWALRASQFTPKGAASSWTTRGFAPSHVRFAHAIPRPAQPKGPSVQLKPQHEAEAIVSGQAPDSESGRPAIPRHAHRQAAYYQLSFTCVPCGHRSHHNISKQGYHTGSILITCPGCRDRHVISDHLEIFGDRKITVEDLMRERGRLVKRGSLGEDGDVEFWPDEPPEQSTKETSERLTGDSREARDS
ncbi:DNL zinc finger domain-containing protein [Hirsutella rhossiliensis]|uniref:DNL zinc finger domain-containing protein n=1 Tax=Hirsutella rhossiliensis TaxID=111463 RepID=A0A9P8MS22_9HYPO|nr:DNL zinc finger domain-containing protein [Hirsutella rhossiliensis]KAH0960893.1 DNL zinc finger domain-containing protein [Hirsutella rhossiliensis]